jgi:phytoene dehydrogenase-like protein
MPVKGKVKNPISDFATEIIVNASVPNLAEVLLPEEQGKILSGEISGLKTGASLLTVYFGFKVPLKELGNSNYSTFVFDSSVNTPNDILSNNHSGFKSRGFTLVDYSQINSGLAPAGKSVGAVCCIDYVEDWDKLDHSLYLDRKNEVVETIISRCEKLIPGFRDAIEYVEAGTSLTVKRYTLNPAGAVYGFARNPGISAAYLSALPENIHIASAWGKFGGGFSGVIYSGYLTAMDILRKRY